MMESFKYYVYFFYCMKNGMLIFVLILLICFNLNYVDATVAPSPYSMVDYSDQSGSVDLATGDMSLGLPVVSVPGIDGGLSYDIGLGYAAGITVDQVASEVGLGWGLNLPSISRVVKGVPDDYNQGQVTNTYIYDKASDSVFYRHYEKRTNWISHWVNVGFQVARSAIMIASSGGFSTFGNDAPPEMAGKLKNPNNAHILMGAGETLMNTGNAATYYAEIITESEFSSLGRNEGINGFMYLSGYYPQGDDFLMEVNSPDAFLISSPVYSGEITYPTYGGFHSSQTSSEAYLCMVPTSSSGNLLEKDTFELISADGNYCDNPLSIKFILNNDLSGQMPDAPSFNKIEMVGPGGVKYLFEATSIVNSSSVIRTKYPGGSDLVPDCNKLFDGKEDFNYLEIEFKKPYVQEWSLTRIESTRNSEDFVEFIYSPWKLAKSSWPASDDESDEVCSYNPDGTISKSISELYTRDIIAIQTGTHRAEFVNEDNSLGVQLISGELPKKVENIELWYLGNDGSWDSGNGDDLMLENFDFNYFSAPDSLNVGPLGVGLTLESVQSCGLSGECLPETKFEYGYNPEYSFQENWYNKDRWGYFCSYCSSGDTWHNFRGLETGQSHAWSLTNIYWPNGGTTEWAYEDDRYNYIGNNYIGGAFSYWPYGPSDEDKFGGGYRVQSLINCDGYGDCYTTEYEYLNGALAGEPGSYSSSNYKDLSLGINGGSTVLYDSVFIIPEGNNGYIENNFTTAIDYPDRGYYGGGIRLSYQDPVGNNYVAGIDVPGYPDKISVLPTSARTVLQAPSNAGDGDPDVWEIIYFGGIVQDSSGMPPSYTYYCSNVVDFASGEDCNIFGSQEDASCFAYGSGECEFHFVPITDSNLAHHKWYANQEGPDGTCTPLGLSWHDINGMSIFNGNQCPLITMKSSSQRMESDFVFHWGNMPDSDDTYYKYYSDVRSNDFDPSDSDSVQDFLNRFLASSSLCYEAYETHSNGIRCHLPTSSRDLNCDSGFIGEQCNIMAVDDPTEYGGFSFDKFRGLKESEVVYNHLGNPISITEYEYGINGGFDIEDKNSILGYTTADYNIMFDSQVDPNYLANAHSLPYSTWITLDRVRNFVDGKETITEFEYGSNGLATETRTSNEDFNGGVQTLIATSNFKGEMVDSVDTDCVTPGGTHLKNSGDSGASDYHVWIAVGETEIKNGDGNTVAATKNEYNSSDKCYLDRSYVWRSDDVNENSPDFDLGEFGAPVSDVIERHGDYDRSLLVNDAMGNGARSHYKVLGENCDGDSNGPRLTCIEDSEGNKIRYYYDDYGRLNYTKDANGVEIHYEYDDLHRLKRIYDSVSTAETFYKYNYGLSNGNSLIEGDEDRMNWVQTKTLINGDNGEEKYFVTRSYVDGLGRSKQSSIIKDEDTAIVVKTFYNERGLVDNVTEPVEDNFEGVVKFLSDLGFADEEDYMLRYREDDGSKSKGDEDSVKYFYYKDPLARIWKTFPIGVYAEGDELLESTCGKYTSCTAYEYSFSGSGLPKLSPVKREPQFAGIREHVMEALDCDDPDVDCGGMSGGGLPTPPPIPTNCSNVGYWISGYPISSCRNSEFMEDYEEQFGLTYSEIVFEDGRSTGCIAGADCVVLVEYSPLMCGHDYEPGAGKRVYCIDDGLCHSVTGELSSNSPNDCEFVDVRTDCSDLIYSHCRDLSELSDIPFFEVIFGDGHSTGCSDGKVCIALEVGESSYICGQNGVYCIDDGFCHINAGEDVVNSPNDCSDAFFFVEGFSYQKIIDAENNKVTSKIDKFGNVVGIKNSLNDVSYFEYDVLGRPLNTIDFKGRSHDPDLEDGEYNQFNYNVLGQLLKEYDLNSGVTEYTYDDVGNVITILNENDKLIENFYDDLYRLNYTKIDGLLALESFYDVDSNGGSCRDGLGSVGFLCEVKDYANNAAIKYKYNVEGNLIEFREEFGANVYITRYDYDDIGNVVWVKLPNGQEVSYSYNPLNQLDSATIDGIPQDFEFEYEPNGMIDVINYPDNSFQNFSYNGRKWLEELVVRDELGSSIFHEVYSEYDNVGNLGKIEDSMAAIRTFATFDYDDLYRLNSFSNVGEYYDESSIGFTGLSGVSYDYDAVGNRLSRTVVGDGGDIIKSVLDYDYGSNDQLDDANGCTYEYNGIGALENKSCPEGTTDYVYDIYEKLVKIEMETGILEFGYDALGRRVWKSYLAEGESYPLYTAYVYGAGSNPNIVMEPYYCPGDINEDGVVDLFTDVVLLQAAVDAGDLDICDYNNNGVCDQEDNSIFGRGLGLLPGGCLGISSSAVNGDGICEAYKGETCANAFEDCAGKKADCSSEEICLGYDPQNGADTPSCAVSCSSSFPAGCFRAPECPQVYGEITGYIADMTDPLTRACHDLDPAQEAHYETWLCCAL
jgi:YD repeat-containing protein